MVSAFRALPAQLDLEGIAGYPLSLTATCTGATITAATCTLYDGVGIALSGTAVAPTVTTAGSVITVSLSAAQMTTLQDTYHLTTPRTLAYQINATVNGSGPYPQIAGKLKVFPYGTTGVSTTTATALTVTVGGATVALSVTASTGMPSGGTTGQYLAKTSGADYAVGWTTATGTGDLLASNNLSELTATASTARTNLGLGTAATTAATAYATATGLSDHLGDTIASHAASAISFSAVGTIAATDVQTAIAEVATDAAAAYQPVATVLTNTTAAFTTAQETKLSGIETAATADQTAAEILAALLTVDGAASGLDADLLDGQSSAYYATAASVTNQAEWFTVAVGDETTALTTGVGKVSFRMPFACTLTALRASLVTASSSGVPTVDVNETGTSVMTTNKLTIDANELTSTTAATACGITDSAIADDALITIDIDVAGTGAAGLKVTFFVTRT